MAFTKIGTPQKITVLSDKCVICGVRKGQHLINGTLVCNECAKEKENAKEEINEDKECF